jgi:hypothetical protein
MWGFVYYGPFVTLRSAQSLGVGDGDEILRSAQNDRGRAKSYATLAH